VGADELAANLFRASQTEQRLRREEIEGKYHANQTHHNVGRAVRAFIIEQGNPPPEQLPTPDVSIQELQRREQKRIDAERQPSLFNDTAFSDEN
jgi:DNA-damage-inducible protein D